MLNEIGLIKASFYFSNETPLPSHISGSTQIDGVWITSNIMPSLLAILPHYFSIGDYRCFVVNFPIEYFIEEGTIPIV